MKILLFVVLNLITFYSYASTDYKKPQSPTELHQLFAEYFSKQDIDGLGTLFHQDAIFVLDNQGNLARGPKAIKPILKSYLQGDVEMLTHDVSIHINGDTALIRSDWEIVGGPKGTALEVMKYIDGGWLYVIDNPNGF
ncbi:nuclear transport factor 2 family protein [Vibrio splendidus]|jgi:ketosteroid isomerase-like protein|uniref:Nuclear transport factor 2 family protein n=1 Tax=Vibrio splendidus TaxID=29497 RepID=A0ABD5A8D7_VIBSP|nr:MULTISPECIES: nuclear transport factor 2 family protein [Vibrio]MCC4878647.1 nuclear transport factor 2 family protein [Vibrio splendidus]MCF7494918.1 nuclear transport factor 2 family protein [Vibrio sp. L5-1]MCW4440043.1 nuclear transport factor 2 family protein [Vibrio splendidus]MDH5886336.1 nuclear transport factor 2 family protein [Vibrio splendidus]MDH5911866.1 nuclear transport factor 2 family protein [Vibrio splendidus]